MKYIDVNCKKCGFVHEGIAVNGWLAITCLNCRSEIPFPKSRPTKRAADSLKAGVNRLPNILITKDLLPAKSG